MEKVRKLNIDFVILKIKFNKSQLKKKKEKDGGNFEIAFCEPEIRIQSKIQI